MTSLKNSSPRPPALLIPANIKPKKISSSASVTDTNTAILSPVLHSGCPVLAVILGCLFLSVLLLSVLILGVLCWQPYPRSPVLAVLSLQSCSESPIMRVLFCLTFFCLSRSRCPVLAVLLWLSFSGGPLFPVLPRQPYPKQSCPGSPVRTGVVLAVLSWEALSCQSFSGSPILVILFCQCSSACSVLPVLSACPVLLCPFCLSCSTCSVCLSRSSCPVLTVPFWLSRAGGPVLAVLFWLSSPFCPALAV